MLCTDYIYFCIYPEILVIEHNGIIVHDVFTCEANLKMCFDSPARRHNICVDGYENDSNFFVSSSDGGTTYDLHVRDISSDLNGTVISAYCEVERGRCSSNKEMQGHVFNLEILVFG